MKLPKLPPTDSGPLYAYASDVQTFLNVIPETEYKTITSVGNFPLLVSTRISNVVEVRRCQTFESNDSAQGLDDTSISWRRSPDPRQPGVLITELGGLRRGTNYTIVLAICGVSPNAASR